MATKLPKVYTPQAHQSEITQRWLDAGAFAAIPDERPSAQRYVVMMPLPNVTGALHMGHAMDNVMQDLLIRWHRMLGDNTLWQPGTDHAGIATQAVVEKRLFELEGRTRDDIGRDALVERIWAWKDEYQQRIIHQQQEMGCSCDWSSRQITIQPWDASVIKDIEKAILKSDLGLTPSNDGKILRISIPPLTEERRKELVKVIHKMCEDHKVTVRNIRRDSNDLLKSLKKDGDISEDEAFRSQEEVQKITDEHIKLIDECYSEKEKEILEF